MSREADLWTCESIAAYQDFKVIFPHFVTFHKTNCLYVLLGSKHAQK